MKTSKLSERELLLCGASYLYSVIMSDRYRDKLAAAEASVKSVSCAEELVKLVDGDNNHSHPAICKIRQKLMELPPLPLAMPTQYTLAEIVIGIADVMQRFWRQAHAPMLQQPDYDAPIAHLPLVFLSWERVQSYISLAEQLFGLLELSVEDETLRSAYYERAAWQFTCYYLGKSESVTDILTAASWFAPRLSGFGDVEFNYLVKSPSAREKLAQQFGQDGFGSFEQIRACVQIFREATQTQTPRHETVQHLVSLMS